MDRRQLLYGASALGLVTNLNLNHPLIAQVGSAVMGRPVCPKCGEVPSFCPRMGWLARPGQDM